jgi:hypothetical protein
LARLLKRVKRNSDEKRWSARFSWMWQKPSTQFGSKVYFRAYSPNPAVFPA